jgi:2-polyprenyl-3-methyl-5-hydroxy-6-metoxy-1,4-benzoquinol methylase
VKDWKSFWTTYPTRVAPTDFLRQVGKTTGGRPISEEQFQVMVSDLCRHLDLKETDVVLDLCCGNGVITKEMARWCKEVVGVDFSRPLLEVANRYHRPANVRYCQMSLFELSRASLTPPGSFTKVLMYEALQHFRPRDFVTILSVILSLAGAGCVVLIGSVPDRARKWRFYNTPRRRFHYLLQKIFCGHVVGTWWHRRFIKTVCDRLRLECEFLEQSRELHTSHYRFDVRIVCPSAPEPFSPRE